MKTTQIKKVLIAIDYNPTAQKVAETGFSMARSMGAEIVLLHVLEDQMYYSSLEYSPIMGFTDSIGLLPIQLDSDGGLRRAAQHFLDKTCRHLEDTSIQTLIKDGDISESILATAKEIHADIIVMGTHSQKWLEEILIGSEAEKVLKLSQIPLLIIPTKKQKE